MSENKFQGRKFELFARFGQPDDFSDEQVWEELQRSFEETLPMRVYASQEEMEAHDIKQNMNPDLVNSPVYQVRITVECIAASDTPAHENLS